MPNLIVGLTVKRKPIEYWSILKIFRKIERRIPDIDPEYANIDVLMIPASTKHPYTTLMTFGMGSRFMEGTPPELVPEKFGYDELFYVCLMIGNWI